ncbi:MAG: hypothetical protein H6739_16730 [Alphaproteobacteria bacterium]|nr:hypothetical protein [Alphaproteobacteria bacterium]
MTVSRDEARAAFDDAPEQPWFTGVRIKDRRHEPLTPGGRCRLTLFEQVEGDDRPHPRLRTAMPPMPDPSPPAALFSPPEAAPGTPEAAIEAVEAGFRAAGGLLALGDLDPATAPDGSAHYWRNSIRVQRTARFFEEASAWLDRLPLTGRAVARSGIRQLEARAYAGLVQFDDGNTGTYHSYEHDKPFVHYLEALLKTLPEEGTPAWGLLPAEQQEAVRRQRAQARNHLDHLMRHKYAYNGIIETDIERTLGGLLIDRRTRNIASETTESQHSLVPQYELLRVEPAAEHPHAGAWVYRDGDALRLQDGTRVEVAAEQLRAVPVPADRLTFLRAPQDPRLRRGVRLDWDGSGFVRQGKVGWVSWAGHCDIKAIMEQLGITLEGPLESRPKVEEYRSDTGDLTEYSRDLLIEMIASVLELGSRYNRVDGSGAVVRGEHHFGGARNDSRPDRLQFTGLRQGRHFRWPLSTRQETFTITGLTRGGAPVDVDTAFLRYLPDAVAVDFANNPQFIKTVEGDYNLIDVSGAVLTARVKLDRFDAITGYPEQDTETLTIDLRPDYSGPRQLLGTHMKDAGARELYRVWFDHKARRVELIPERYTRDDAGRWVAKELPGQAVRIPLVAPLSVTLSREMKEDDPELLDKLLRIAIRQGQNICADTDMAAEVWNGVVTRVESERVAWNAATRVERWKVFVKARFGNATLEYLLRLDDEGHASAYCPLPGGKAPDFFWQDFPDVGSKGIEGRDWVVNSKMLERGLIDVEEARWAQGGVYVHDEHIKNVYEILWAGLSGHRWTIVHGNKRYGFTEREAWETAVLELERLREAFATNGRSDELFS